MGEYATYIWAAYGVVAVVLVGLTCWIWADLRRQSALLAALERTGAPRRRRARPPAPAAQGTAP
jgi:heme exporter protein CcmD